MTAMRATVAVRAIVSHEDKLLLVTHGADYWYTPGGRLEPGETLPDCVAREVREETGLTVSVGDVVAVSEYVEHAKAEHKVECYFRAELVDSPERFEAWQDTGGPVKSYGLFSEDELATMNVQPSYLTSFVSSQPSGPRQIYVQPS